MDPEHTFDRLDASKGPDQRWAKGRWADVRLDNEQPLPPIPGGQLCRGDFADDAQVCLIRQRIADDPAMRLPHSDKTVSKASTEKTKVFQAAVIGKDDESGATFDLGKRLATANDRLTSLSGRLSAAARAEIGSHAMIPLARKIVDKRSRASVQRRAGSASSQHRASGGRPCKPKVASTVR